MRTGTPETKSTRVRVQDAAWELIEAGQAPSRAKIRDRIGTGGSDATIADELIQFWPALGEFVLQSRTQPEIPAEFLQSFRQLVNQARMIEKERWAVERENRIQACKAAEEALAEKTQEHQELASHYRGAQERMANAEQQVHSIGELNMAQEKRIQALEQDLAAQSLQLEDALQRESRLREEKKRELEQAYGRADETEKRLTGLYDKERTAREKVDQRLAEQLERVRELDSAGSRLEAQNQGLEKDVVRLEARVDDLSGVEKSLFELDKLHGAVQAQLVESREREGVTVKKLEALQQTVVDAQVEKAGLQSDLKAHLKTMAEQGRQIKSLENAANKRAK